MNEVKGMENVMKIDFDLKGILQGAVHKDRFWIRLVIVVTAVIMMGFSLSWLLLADLGPDPYTMLNNAVSRKMGISLGTWQALLNSILLVGVLLFGGRNIGFGTLANMLLVGYSIDFFSWVWRKALPLEIFGQFYVRLLIMVPALILFIVSAAVYMDIEMGSSPYDAIPFIIYDHLKKIPFRLLRIFYDLLFILVAMIFGGKLGIVTVLMAFTLGPVIERVGKMMKKIL